ncbi:hypothetical protein QQZ08_011177 [Neonectria magnoliae]|uniref:Uncharacterized protein n=1 Tax=Neonectria magnoliae TaxID=2732573 RepID=A0ABR1HCL1_9HYPO
MWSKDYLSLSHSATHRRVTPRHPQGDTDEVAALVKSIKAQLKQLYKAIEKYNPHFWKWTLDDPATAVSTRLQAYSPQLRQEAFLIIEYSYSSWVETPGTLDVIRALRKAV